MALFLKYLFILSLNILFTTSFSHNPILPKAAIIPVTKDHSTLQYTAQVFIGEKCSPVKLVLDINNPLVWFNCEANSHISSHQPIKSCSIQCSMSKSTSCFSNSKICTLQTENTLSRMSTSGELNEGRIGLELWDETNSCYIAKSVEFVFSCAPNLLLKGLANGAKGILGLGNSRIALPSQVSSKFGFFERKFSICLSKSKGAVFLGGSPFENEMVYTPLGYNKNGYFINVNSIKISDKKVVSFSREIAKISTTVAYTTMESKIFRTFVEDYVRAAKEMKMSLVPRVYPFEVCFSSKEVKNVPIVDLFLQSEMVKWRFDGRKMMVPVGNDVMCLAFLDRGLKTMDSIVIGGYQLEDYLLEFNMGNSMFGFSSSFNCSGFQASALF